MITGNHNWYVYCQQMIPYDPIKTWVCTRCKTQHRSEHQPQRTACLAPSAPPTYNPANHKEGRMTTYRDRLNAGIHDANKQQEPEAPDPDNLPSRHAALDELATARGLIWSDDNLSVAYKQAELAAHLES